MSVCPAGVVHQENVWLQMLSESQDFVQGSKCGERRTKNGRRDWNTDGTLSLSVPAQIPPEFKAFVGCWDGAGSLMVPQM